MEHLKYVVYCIYDYIWDRIGDAPFAQKLCEMFDIMRYRKAQFARVPDGMRNFTDWEEIKERYANYMPCFFYLVECLLRQLFR